jgi:hypothetical protein
MYKIKKHKSHISGRFKCRPFGKFKKKVQKEEWEEWLKNKQRNAEWEEWLKRRRYGE